ncbi:MAG: fructosamine kinase family protein [Microcoleaceae cyanobacterium]
MWKKIAEHITQVTGEKFEVSNHHSVGGGCINTGYKLTDGNRNYFVKLNQASQVAMFEAEALGLKQMCQTQTILLPKSICYGTEGNNSYIVLEWLDLDGRSNDKSWEEMGHNLAALHHYQSKSEFGWDINNTIGSTPQINTWARDWAEFWAENRIGYQLKLAKRRGGSFSQSDRLVKIIPELLAGHKPQPSLVHGDLWGGNAGVTADGEPVIFDPATYWGDREVDIAMTELFGGFPNAFYRGYNEAWPLDDGYKQRKTLYNLYHILNHFNIFGGGYGSQAERMIQQILR